MLAAPQFLPGLFPAHQGHLAPVNGGQAFLDLLLPGRFHIQIGGGVETGDEPLGNQGALLGCLLLLCIVYKPPYQGLSKIEQDQPEQYYFSAFL
jgi:hypothetical protein